MYDILENFTKNLRISREKIKILVLGSGEGAFERRLLDNGYRDITAVDIRGDYAIDEVNYIRYDLESSDFKDVIEILGGPFHIIVAIEAIEHLNSPYAFLQKIKKLLRSDGIAIVTTPNISEISSRLLFMLKGEFRLFQKQWISLKYGHISPLPDFIFRELARRAGLSVIGRKINRTYWQAILVVGKKRPLLWVILWLLTIPFYLMIWLLLSRKREDAGIINIYILAHQKTHNYLPENE